jgi:signal transduction histidine kinase
MKMPRWTSLGLRTRLTLIVLGVTCASIFMVSSYFVQRYQRDLAETNASKTAIIREQLRRKGMAVVRHVALASERALVVMDLSFLSEVVRTTVESDPELVYGIVMDRGQRAIIHTDPAQADSVLADAGAAYAASVRGVDSQILDVGGESVLEVIAPVHVAGKTWGSIRFGLSQKGLLQEIRQTEERAQAQVRSTIALSLVAVLFMVLLASVLAGWLADRISRPVGVLLAGVNRVSRGDMSASVHVEGSPEFVILGAAFNQMTCDIQERDRELRDNMAQLAEAVTQAQEASRLKTEFLANVSHELRTPLNAIVNVPGLVRRGFEPMPFWECVACAQAFEEDAEAPGSVDVVATPCPACGGALVHKWRAHFVGEAEEAMILLDRLDQSGRHLLALVNDLLDFSKLDAGKMELFPGEVDLSQVLDELLSNVGPLAQAKGLTLHLPRLGAPPRLQADPVKLMQILVNLVGNAIKFTPAGGTVTVSVEDRSATLHVRVADTGIGIAADKFPLLFQSFRQVDGSHTRAHKGTGLGLAITKRLVELHGGTIEVESTPGRGSTFSFTLPKERAGSARDRTAANHPEGPSRSTVPRSA